jgi:hypothetical protein
MRVPTALTELLEDMGWIHWRDQAPPNTSKEILMLDLRYGNVYVGPASDFNYRLRAQLERGAKKADLWNEWWMPIPVPPRRIIKKYMEAS